MKRLLKITLALALCVLSVCSLFACGGDGDKTTKKGLTCTYKDGSYTLNRYVGEENVTTLDIGKAFKDAYGEDAVLTKIGTDAFLNDNTLTKVIVPGSVTTISSGAFSKMRKLEEIELPFVGGKLKADAFMNQTEESPDKAVDNERLFAYIFGTIEYEGGAKITINDYTCYIPATLGKVKINPVNNYEIPMYAFKGLTQIYQVTLGDKVVGIGEFAFSSLEQYTSFDIPSSVKTIYKGAFKDCKKLAVINFGGDATLWNAVIKKEEWNLGVAEGFKVCDVSGNEIVA